MELREYIGPKIMQIEEIYPQVLSLLYGYDNVCDNENDDKCLGIMKQLSELTHKVITKDILSKYMEDDSICMVALRLSITDPPLLHTTLSRDELLEIIQRIYSKNHIEYKVKVFPEDELWWVLSHDYYVPLLEKIWNYQNLRLFVNCYIKKLYSTVCGIDRKKYLKKF